MSFYSCCNVVDDVLLEDFAGGDSGEIFTVVTTPRTFKWTNDHHSADSFRMELDDKGLPLDPRLVWAIRIQALCPRSCHSIWRGWCGSIDARSCGC